MLKSLGRVIVALVAAVGIAVSPTVGLALAEPADETEVVTTTPLPPPAEAPPPETEVPPSEPPAEAPPPAEVPAPPPSAEPPPAEPPAEEVPPPADVTPSEQPAPPPPADEPVPEPPANPPAEEPSADPPASESTTEPAPPPADQTQVETTPSADVSTPPSDEETSPPEASTPQAPDASQPPSDGSTAEVPETTQVVPPDASEPPAEGTGTEQPAQPPAEQNAVTPAEEAEPAVATVPESPSVDQADVQQAFAKEPLVEQPMPVPTGETDRVYEQIKTSLPNHNPGGPGGRPDGWNDDRNRDHDRWDGRVRPWSPDWIKYDNPRHHGPVFCNPYRDRDIKIFYVYQGHQYVRVIPPLQSIFVNVDVRVHNVHSFTAVHVKTGNIIVDVNVGTFHHPAYVPPVHQNVNVKVVVNNHYYPRPFTVKKVVDCGYDQVRRKTRVVFDNTYVAWGNWRGNGKNRHFALEEAATYPGMYGKAAEVVAAPPEPYVAATQPRNVAAETQLTSNEGWIIGGGALALALAVGALAWALMHRRDGTPPQHT